MAGLCQVEVDTQSLAGCQTAHPSGACGTGSLLCDPDSCLTLGPINPVSPCDMPCSWELTHTEDTSVDPSWCPFLCLFSGLLSKACFPLLPVVGTLCVILARLSPPVTHQFLCPVQILCGCG